MFKHKNKIEKFIFFAGGFLVGVMFVVFLYKVELKVYGYLSSGDGLGRLKAFGKKVLIDSGVSRTP